MIAIQLISIIQERISVEKIEIERCEVTAVATSHFFLVTESIHVSDTSVNDFYEQYHIREVDVENTTC